MLFRKSTGYLLQRIELNLVSGVVQTDNSVLNITQKKYSSRMRLHLLTLISLLLFSPLAALANSSLGCPAPWNCKTLSLKIPYRELSVPYVAQVKIRTGVYPAQGSIAGRILYLEGLGDSMLNHQPLFERLSRVGYEVIAFDYMGQGGSSGSMDHTRIEQIAQLGNAVWKYYTKDQTDSAQKTVIGWSTGGLAAYFMASKGQADQVILIAPGIVPNKIVGEGLLHWPLDEITLKTLTHAVYPAGAENPHYDPIYPNTPAAVMGFSLNLLTTSKKMQSVKIDKKVRGLVLLSGPSDTYVNAERTAKVLAKNASHFTVLSYPNAFHEIDNEVPKIQLRLQNDILNFLGHFIR